MQRDTFLDGGYTIREKPPKWNTKVLVETRSWYVKFCFKNLLFFYQIILDIGKTYVFETKHDISWLGFNMYFWVPFGRFFTTMWLLHNDNILHVGYTINEKPPKWNRKGHVETQSWYVKFCFKNLLFDHIILYMSKHMVLKQNLTYHDWVSTCTFRFHLGGLSPTCDNCILIIFACCLHLSI